MDKSKYLCKLLGELTLSHIKVHLADDDESKAAQLFDKLHMEAEKPKFMTDETILQRKRRRRLTPKQLKCCPNDLNGIDILMEIQRKTKNGEFQCDAYPARATCSLSECNEVETIEYVTNQFRDCDVAYLWSPSEYKREVEDAQQHGEYNPYKGVMKITPILDEDFDMAHLWWLKNTRSFFLRRDKMYFEAEGILDANTTIRWTTVNDDVKHNFIFECGVGWVEVQAGMDQGHNTGEREPIPPAKKSPKEVKKKRKPETDQVPSTPKRRKKQELNSNTTLSCAEDCLSTTLKLLKSTVTQLTVQVKRLECTVKELQDTVKGLKTQNDKIQSADV